jgi:hypothetical protein
VYAVGSAQQQRHVPAGPPASSAAVASARSVAVAALSSVDGEGRHVVDQQQLQGSSRSRSARRSSQAQSSVPQQQLQQQQQQGDDLDLEQLQTFHDQLLVLQRQQQQGEQVDSLLLELQEQQQGTGDTYLPEAPAAAAGDAGDDGSSGWYDAAEFGDGGVEEKEEEAAAALEAYGFDEQQLQELQQDLDAQLHLQQQQQQQKDVRLQLQQDQQQQPGMDRLLQQMQQTHNSTTQHFIHKQGAGSSSSGWAERAVVGEHRQGDQQEVDYPYHNQHPQRQQQQQYDYGSPAAWESQPQQQQQLTRELKRVSHPQALLTLLLASGVSGGLNQVHLTAAAEALARLARQQQQMRDPGYKRKVWRGVKKGRAEITKIQNQGGVGGK